MTADDRQEQAPVLEALREHDQSPHVSFAPPGHRQGKGADERVLQAVGADVFSHDYLANGELDDRAGRGQVLARAEALMAKAVGAEHAFFTTCGSSLSVKSAMLAVAGRAGSLLLGRDAHKSAISGLVLGGIEPVWVHPQWDSSLHLAHPPSPDDFAAGLEQAPDVGGVMVTSPSPYGTCADLAAIAEVCHAAGKPLIVDEAWGAHLPFHDDLPTWAMDAGADLCVVSAHKMGTGLEQGSVFHVQGDLIDLDHLAACADMLSTTSPNVLVYAALDGWRRQMVQHGTRLLGEALALARLGREQIRERTGLVVLHEQLCGAQASHDLDELHLLVQVDALGISGYQAADWLRENEHLDVHLADAQRVEAQISVANTEADIELLVQSLGRLCDASASFDPPPAVELPEPGELELEQVLSPREAFFAPVQDVPVQDAADRIAAEQITPYPPGIPALLPGERIGQAVLDYLVSGRRAGMFLPDAADSDLGTIRVVAET
ncbi:aminotransferase class I/II-fold pyridoxal phosphate-dependent enzyme [Marmoricola sp. URHB0036]|uniref:aminotransferase class I/II-fold pyridoxal phosphate-dependent enzyme n=1 Tax=Marmoricola sp. URHB0036 TaxID=1298863 RepID=UPI00040D37B3|nr:ornithine decarboxylase [Marmoricola sp. URHB0036]